MLVCISFLFYELANEGDSHGIGPAMAFAKVSDFSK